MSMSHGNSLGPFLLLSPLSLDLSASRLAPEVSEEFWPISESLKDSPEELPSFPLLPLQAIAGANMSAIIQNDITITFFILFSLILF